jgi:tRNA dimethylallyltransferase
MKIDIDRANNLHPNDTYRIKRALEINFVNGIKYNDFVKKKKKLFDEILAIGLIDDRESIYKRINDRVEKMLYDGLIDEVHSIIQKYNSIPIAFSRTIGYMEVVNFLNGKWGIKKMVSEIKKNTRHFAKRQLLWLKNEKGIKLFQHNEEDKIKREIKKFIEGE